MTGELGGQYTVPQSSVVDNYLLTIDWGADIYPLNLLELTQSERYLLEQLQTGHSVKGVARADGIPIVLMQSRCLIARGKQEAQAGLADDVLSLSPLAQRVVILNDLFGSTWSRGKTTVITTPPEIIISNSLELDKMLGDKWRRRCPQLSVMSIGTLRSRIASYDTLMGPNWRNTPQLLTQSSETIKSRIVLYDRWFGDAWYVHPHILTNQPRTVISSARTLQTIGITQENTPSGPYFSLLCTTVAKKREKAAYIRQVILGHQQVYLDNTPKPLSERIKDRQFQSAQDKKREAEELEEFKVFIKQLGARMLGFSIEKIASWAYSNGYRPPRIPLNSNNNEPSKY